MRALDAAMDDIERATRDLPAPLAVLHLPSLRANLEYTVRRAGRTRVRIASKSVRVRKVLEQALGADLSGGDDIRGIMAYSLREALWLVECGCRDVLIGYPTTDRQALARLGADAEAKAAITLMVDDVAHAEIAEAAGAHGVRMCIDVDSSLRLGPVHLGTRRSPLHTVDEVEALARTLDARGHEVVGAMFYEAQVAGVQDNVFGIGPVKALSMRRLVPLRQEVAQALERVTGRKPEILNSGGTGSVEASASAPAVTEVTVGSGLFVPGTFDHFKSFTPRPALFFGLDAVRSPAPGMSTLLYGGYIASGAPGADRLPVPVRPRFAFTSREGAGEVQTPIDAPLPIGGRAWLRHGKAGELAERFAEIVVVDSVDGTPAVVDTWATYRGEGKCFG
ncbi:MAG TPA: amino acid deaminase/aldolase [Dietzia timorensis]|uniref:Amino acid deaminase/aldolase n=1 Tax=Dietzia timorensis TaxID=499555 RepID=A0A921F747_9ACTN|nr:amino acid deaminase/aldolase [Dietzia timorensis]HJE91643.1 amino acid deaminase/aldolase [Dietzia timorensis]